MSILPLEARMCGPRTPTAAERAVFGEDVQLHPLTWLPIQVGVGATSPDEQAVGHLRVMRAWADKCEMWIADLADAIADATDDTAAARHHKELEGAVADLELINNRIKEATDVLGAVAS